MSLSSGSLSWLPRLGRVSSVTCNFWHSYNWNNYLCHLWPISAFPMNVGFKRAETTPVLYITVSLGNAWGLRGNICQMSEWIFRTAATLKYISRSSFNYSPSLAFRFQKLNIPCLQLEINHTIERILQYYVAELEATKKASIMFINRTELFVQKEKYAASICRHYLVPNLLD